MQNLHEDVLELFAELDGRDRYDAAIERWSSWRRQQARERQREYRSRPAVRARIRAYDRAWRRTPKGSAANVEQVRRWRLANPEKARALLRRSAKLWKQRNPEKAREIARRAKARRRADPVRGPLLRERDRRNKAAERARKKAAAQAGGPS